MQYAGLLQTIAVISMGFAGFAALVSTLSRVSMDPKARVHRVRTMVLISLFALLFSLFPFLPAAFDASEETTWRLSSALFGLGLTAPLWLQGFFPRLADPALAGRCLRLLATCVPALFGAGLCLPFLIARGAERRVLGISACGLAVMLAGFFVARPALGVAAGALGLALCEWTVFLLAARAVQRTEP